MNEFSEYLSKPSYIQSREAFGARSHVVYVEDETDIRFWELIIDSNRYEIKPISQVSRHHSYGKRTIEGFYSKANAFFVLAVDADYDYLCAEKNELTQQLVNSPYILHTFAYSKESILNDIDYLKHIFSLAKLTTTLPTVDMQSFFVAYSRLIHPFLEYYLYFYNKNEEHILTPIIHLKQICGLTNFSKKDEKTSSYHLNDDYFEQKEKEIKEVCLKLNKLINDEQDFHAFQEKLAQRGLSANNACYFMNGHDLDRQLQEPLLKSLIHFRQDIELASLQKEDSSRRKHISKYFKEKCNIATLMNSHMTFLSQKPYKNPFFKQIVDKYQQLQNLTPV